MNSADSNLKPVPTLKEITPKWPGGPTRENLVERLRDAEQAGREIIVEWDHDPFLFGEAADEIERLRKALEVIAGSATDKLQATQARGALPNIG